MTSIKIKEIDVSLCDSQPIGKLMKRLHYSHTAAINPRWNFGFFHQRRLIGGAQFGPPLCYHKVLPLVVGTQKTDMVELNRFVLIPESPKGCASRCLSVCLRHLGRMGIKWVLSYANSMRSGNGTIYRATGFVLCGIKENHNSRHPSFYILPDGRTVHVMSLKRTVRTKINTELRVGELSDVTSGELLRRIGAVPARGITLRYVRFLDRTWEERLSVPVLPYSCAVGVVSDAPRNQRGEDGATPITALYVQRRLF